MKLCKDSRKQRKKDAWPQKKDKLPNEDKLYWQLRNEIPCIGNLNTKDQRLLFNQTCVIILQMLQHMGIIKCKPRDREFIYWRELLSDLQDIVEKFQICTAYSKKTTNMETMINSKLPDRTSSKLAADYFKSQENKIG